MFIDEVDYRVQKCFDGSCISGVVLQPRPKGWGVGGHPIFSYSMLRCRRFYTEYVMKEKAVTSSADPIVADAQSKY